MNRKIGQAMHDYHMLEDGDRVLVAVSGGVDSMVLCCILRQWQKKAPIRFEIVPLHIDHGFWRRKSGESSPHKKIFDQLQRHGIDLRTENEWSIQEKERSCYLCARNRRSQLFDLARRENFTKIALGHHKDDLLETFMLNILYSGNVSTMIPRQQLFNETLSLIRPMAYLEKQEIYQLARQFDVHPVKNLCPLSDNTRREKVRDLLHNIYSDEPGAKNSMFAALSNIRKDYLL